MEGQTVAKAPKRLTVAIQGEPVSVFYRVQKLTASTPGADAIQSLVHATMASVDNQGALHPQLAEVVPSAENGLWRVLADGRMEITWQIRAGAQWHDGHPFTAADLAFTAALGLDRIVPAFGHPGFAYIDRVEQRDARTVVVFWKRPYLQADGLFTAFDYGDFGAPLPRHLLEPVYRESPDAMVDLPYWHEAFVGTGPYRVLAWERGSHLALRAWDGYALGKPRIDEILVKILPDQNTMVANLLAGEVQLTIGKTLSLEQALQVEAQWRDGRLENSLANWVVIFPQLLNPSPEHVANLQFRRALLHSMNREEIVDTLMGGHTRVAHIFTNPEQREWAAIEPSIVRYNYDPARASTLFEASGLVRGTDGTYRTPSGEPFEVELRTDAGNDLFRKVLLAVADDWERAGVRVLPRNFVPPQRSTDREYASTFPGFALTRHPGDFQSLVAYRSANAPVAENNFRGPPGGVNRARYMNPEFDALIDRYLVTIPWDDRMRIAQQVVRTLTDQVVTMGLFYDIEPTLIWNRLRQVTARTKGSVQTWNAHEWDLM